MESYCKILVIRFSSIGDIVLTTPIVRALKQQLKNVEIHYLTKKSNYSLLQNNKYIDKIHLLEEGDLYSKLRKNKFDYALENSISCSCSVVAVQALCSLELYFQ